MALFGLFGGGKEAEPAPQDSQGEQSKYDHWKELEQATKQNPEAAASANFEAFKAEDPHPQDAAVEAIHQPGPEGDGGEAAPAPAESPESDEQQAA